MKNYQLRIFNPSGKKNLSTFFKLKKLCSLDLHKQLRLILIAYHYEPKNILEAIEFDGAVEEEKKFEE